MVQHIHVEEENMKAVFVDTNLRTHLLCLVSPHSNFYELREQIVKEHDEFYKDFGNITINWLKVTRDQKHYHLSENIRLRTAFHGAKTWFVFANVGLTPLDHPPKELSIPVKKLGNCNHSKSKSGKKKRSRSQISQHEEHLNVQSVEVVKPVEKTPTFSVNGLPEEQQRDFLLTNGTISATKHRKGMSASEGHYNDLNDIPFQEVLSNLAEMASPKKLRASEQKVKNTDLPMSPVAEFKEENLTISTSSKQVMNSQVPLGDTVNSGARKLGKKNPARKSGVLRPNLNARSKSSATSSLISVKSAKTIHKEENTEVQKKKNQEIVFKMPSNKNMGIPLGSLGLFGLFCDSPDNEVERSGSSCNIGTLDDSSSSDSSEGKSEGDKVTSQHESKGSRSARDDKNSDLSALKGQDLASVLRRSSQYKKAVKQVALQSQMEDGETEPVESVPDSYSD